jgi:hypothetical protein
MENKAVGIGTIVMLAMVLIVGVILMQGSAQNVGSMTNTVSVDTNITAPANGTAYYFTDYRALTGVTVTNASNKAAISSGNYTITNNVVYNGQLATKLVPDASAGYQAVSWNVVATGQPLTYSDDSGSRSVAGLIILLMALALIVVAASVAVKSYNE